MSEPPTLQDVKLVSLVLPIIGTVFTVTRVIIRATRNRFGIDDFFAVAANLFLIAFATAMWFYFTPGSVSPSMDVILYYFVAEGFYCIVWSVRLSILFSTIIIAKHLPSTNRILRACALLFLAIWMELTFQFFYICESETAWKTVFPYQCYLGLPVALNQTATNVLGDLILIWAPISIVFQTSLPNSTRLRLAAVFSSVVVVTVAGFVHNYFEVVDGALKEAVAASVEASVAVIVCNLPAIVMLFQRAFKPQYTNSAFDSVDANSGYPSASGAVTQSFGTK